MGRNRVLGSPFQPLVITTDTTTKFSVDQYLVDAALGSPVTVTLDPKAVQGDQVVIQDVGGNAESQSIVIEASPGQTIVNVGTSINITTNGGGVQLTYDQDLAGWTANVFTLGPGGGGAATWTSVSAGGAVAVTAGVFAAFEFDTTGARCSVTFPNAPVDGQVAVLKAVGASNTDGIHISPGTGQSLEDPGNAGNILAANTSVTFFVQGGCLTYRYQAAGTRWLIQANA
jgi:hypothetical protein